jgi:adenylylsulfate kinase
VDAGLIVIAPFISPFQADRDAARALFANGDFVEVYIEAPLEVAEMRDPKGLYKKARAGALAQSTGIDSPYQPRANPELHIETLTCSPQEALQEILAAVGPLLNPKASQT